MSEIPAYRYRATITRWVDGDTVDVSLDLGFYITVNTRLRLIGIDTPERGMAGYREAADRATHLAPPGAEVVVSTYKRSEKYGRFLAIIHTAGEVDVAARLIDEQLGKPYFGGTKE